MGAHEAGGIFEQTRVAVPVNVVLVQLEQPNQFGIFFDVRLITSGILRFDCFKSLFKVFPHCYSIGIEILWTHPLADVPEDFLAEFSKTVRWGQAPSWVFVFEV